MGRKCRSRLKKFKTRSKDKMPIGSSTVIVRSIRIPRCVWEHFGPHPSTAISDIAIAKYKREAKVREKKRLAMEEYQRKIDEARMALREELEAISPAA